MKILVVFLLIGIASAQNSTSESIQKDFDDTFNYYQSLAQKFVDGLGVELEARVKQYVAAHEKYINQLRNILEIPNLKISENNQEIINEGISFVKLLIDEYKNSLNKNIFINEFNKYMGMLTSQYLSKAQQLIDQLKKEISKNSTVGQCWTNARDELANIVKTGFLAARDAAITTVGSAKLTLDFNEFIVNATVDSNALFISSCQLPGVDLDSCISTFITIAQVTIKTNVGLWGSMTDGALRTNLQLAEILINSAALNAMNGIVPVVNTIERCVRSILGI